MSLVPIESSWCLQAISCAGTTTIIDIQYAVNGVYANWDYTLCASTVCAYSGYVSTGS